MLAINLQWVCSGMLHIILSVKLSALRHARGHAFHQTGHAPTCTLSYFPSNSACLGMPVIILSVKPGVLLPALYHAIRQTRRAPYHTLHQTRRAPVSKLGVPRLSVKLRVLRRARSRQTLHALPSVEVGALVIIGCARSHTFRPRARPYMTSLSSDMTFFLTGHGIAAAWMAA